MKTDQPTLEDAMDLIKQAVQIIEREKRELVTNDPGALASLHAGDQLDDDKMHDIRQREQSMAWALETARAAASYLLVVLPDAPASNPSR